MVGARESSKGGTLRWIEASARTLTSSAVSSESWRRPFSQGRGGQWQEIHLAIIPTAAPSGHHLLRFFFFFFFLLLFPRTMAATTVQRILEETVPDLESLAERELFSLEEIQSIVRTRRTLEYKVLHRNKAALRRDFFRLIRYELQLHRLLSMRLRSRPASQAPPSAARQDDKNSHHHASNYCFVRRAFFTFERLVMKFEEDVSVWLAYASFAESTRSVKSLSRIYGRALQFHPTDAKLWIRAANFELRNGHIQSSRTLLQRSLRLQIANRDLWLAFFHLECLISEMTSNMPDIRAAPSSSAEAPDKESAERVARGDVVLAVHDDAVAALPDDFEMRKKMFLDASNFRLHAVRDAILAAVQRDFAGSASQMSMIVDMQLRDRLLSSDLDGEATLQAVVREYVAHGLFQELFVLLQENNEADLLRAVFSQEPERLEKLSEEQVLLCLRLFAGLPTTTATAAAASQEQASDAKSPSDSGIALALAAGEKFGRSSESVFAFLASLRGEVPSAERLPSGSCHARLLSLLSSGAPIAPSLVTSLGEQGTAVGDVDTVLATMRHAASQSGVDGMRRSFQAVLAGPRPGHKAFLRLLQHMVEMERAVDPASKEVRNLCERILQESPTSASVWWDTIHACRTAGMFDFAASCLSRAHANLPPSEWSQMEQLAAKF